MFDSGRREAVSSNLTLLIGCLALSLLCYALPGKWSASLVTGIRETVLRPVVALRMRAERDRTSRFKLAVIEASRDSLALLVQRDTALVQENASLRSLLGLPARRAGHWVSAEVVHQRTPTDPRTVLLSVGTDDGVATNDPVVTANGLLGVIWEAGSAFSTALTWQHPDFRVSAYTGNGDVLGIVGPVPVGGESLLEMHGVALRDTVATGEVIYSSGLGGVYPRAIPIGRTVGVDTDPLGYERLYKVAPFVNPGAISHVMVLTGRDSTMTLSPPPAQRSDSSR